MDLLLGLKEVMAKKELCSAMYRFCKVTSCVFWVVLFIEARNCVSFTAALRRVGGLKTKFCLEPLCRADGAVSISVGDNIAPLRAHLEWLNANGISRTVVRTNLRVSHPLEGKGI
jgi:hypothetical protein